MPFGLGTVNYFMQEDWKGLFIARKGGLSKAYLIQRK